MSGILIPKRKRSLSVNVALDGNTVVVTAGQFSFFLKRHFDLSLPRQNFDYVLYGLGVLSMVHNVRFELDMPMTAAGVKQIRAFGNAWSDWAMRGLYPMDIHAFNVIDEPAQPRRGGLLCLSGGVDSTHAALSGEGDGYTHALLIAGADYPAIISPGFQELTPRVRAMAEAMGMELLLMESSYKQLGVRWNHFHALHLAMCVKFAGQDMTHAAYAADRPRWTDVVLHPAGNQFAYADFFTTPEFPIRQLGSMVGRTQKVREIIEDGRFTKLISFCWTDSNTGRNCGQCAKCMRTRINCVAAGYPQRSIFDDEIDLVPFVKSLKLPRKPRRIREALVFLQDAYRELPDGELRDQITRYVRRGERRLKWFV